MSQTIALTLARRGDRVYATMRPRRQERRGGPGPP